MHCYFDSATKYVSAVLFTLLWFSSQTMAGGPRVLPEGKQPADVRLGPLKDLNGYFPFTVPASKEEWDARAALVRRQIAVSQGIWPTPEKTPLNVVIHGRIDKADYTVDKIFFES